ncbi:hypothetical protein [Kribbella ginsengisoli]|uniref:hypothetical protein n=1 Tax=Kribbella ginsengisoli TaxID=363865 RepID=UPI0031D932C0
MPGVVVGVLLGTTVGVDVVGVDVGAEGVDAGGVGVGGVDVGVPDPWELGADVSATTGRRELSGVRTDSLGSGVSAARSGAFVTRGAGWCLTASGRGINGVSTCGPPSMLLTSSKT